MIPFQGLIATILGIVALFVLWERPLPGLWWWMLGLLVGDYLLTNAVRHSVQMNGPKSGPTIMWMVVATVAQLAIIGIAIYSFV